MKKLSLILAICIMVMSFASCGYDFIELQATENKSVALTTIHSTKHYDVYIYHLDVLILMKNGDEVPLADALENGLVDMEEIISVAEDSVEPFYFFDGGSLQYVLDDYNIFVSHAVWDGDDFPDAIYFYPRGTTINEVKNNI